MEREMNMFTRFLPAMQPACAVFVCFALAGCGGSSSDAPAGSTPGADAAGSQAATSDTCRLLTHEEISAAVGNPVRPGEPEGAGVCDWDSDEPTHVDALLIVRRGDHAKILCEDIRKAAAEGKGVSGLGEAATWKFSPGGIFNSSDLEVCGGHGYLSLSLNGKADEAVLERAATSLARTAIGRM
jgi:hypothetical protein